MDDLCKVVSTIYSQREDFVLTSHMIAPRCFLNRPLASWTCPRKLVDRRHTSDFLLLPSLSVLVLLLLLLDALSLFTYQALIVLRARLALVKRHVMYRANAEAARTAAKDIALRAGVVDLAGLASLREAVAEAGVVAEEGAHGKLVEPVDMLVM